MINSAPLKPSNIQCSNRYVSSVNFNKGESSVPVHRCYKGMLNIVTYAACQNGSNPVGLISEQASGKPVIYILSENQNKRWTTASRPAPGPTALFH